MLLVVEPIICLSGEMKSSQACDSVRNSGLNINLFFGYFFCRPSTVPGGTVDFTITIFPPTPRQPPPFSEWRPAPLENFSLTGLADKVGARSFILSTADSTMEILQ